MATIRFCIVIIGPRVQRRKLRERRTVLTGFDRYFPRPWCGDARLFGSLCLSLSLSLILILSFSFYLSLLWKLPFCGRRQNHFWAADSPSPSPRLIQLILWQSNKQTNKQTKKKANCSQAFLKHLFVMVTGPSYLLLAALSVWFFYSFFVLFILFQFSFLGRFPSSFTTHTHTTPFFLNFYFNFLFFFF